MSSRSPSPEASHARPTARGLGRGLDAILPRGPALEAGAPLEIPVGNIEPNPTQPRQRFDEAALQELADSIREHGVLQPIIVSHAAGERYTLIAGERRWRAARIAGLSTIPAVLKQAAPQAALAIALVENLQRADLSPLEEASAYHELTESYGLTQEQVARRVGRSRVSVTNRLRLLGLPARARQLLAEGAIAEGHARALLGCLDDATLDALAERVVRQGLSVRSTENLVRRLSEPRQPRAAPSQPDAVEEDLQRSLGTRVQILRSRAGGRVVIHYYDDDQLAGLIDLLLGEPGPHP